MIFGFFKVTAQHGKLDPYCFTRQFLSEETNILLVAIFQFYKKMEM